MANQLPKKLRFVPRSMPDYEARAWARLAKLIPTTQQYRHAAYADSLLQRPTFGVAAWNTPGALAVLEMGRAAQAAADGLRSFRLGLSRIREHGSEFIMPRPGYPIELLPLPERWRVLPIDGVGADMLLVDELRNSEELRRTIEHGLGLYPPITEPAPRFPSGSYGTALQ